MAKTNRFSSIALIGAVATALAAVFCICVPNFVHSGPSKTSGIFNDLRQLDGAAQQWGIEHGRKGADRVTREDVAPYLMHPPFLDGWVKSVAGEKYVLKTLAESPKAELTRELEGRPRGTVFRLGINTVEIILPNPQRGANGTQPSSSETNRTSTAAASRRSP